MERCYRSPATQYSVEAADKWEIVIFLWLPACATPS